MDGIEDEIEDSEVLNNSDQFEADYLDQDLNMDYDLDLNNDDDDEDQLNSKDERTEELDDEQQSLIKFKATVILKDFKGQRSNEVGDTFEFAGDTVDGIFEAMWEVAKQFCNRTLVFSNSRRISGSTKLEYDVEWSSKEIPGMTEMEDYVLVQDPDSKKVYNLNKSKTIEALMKWNDKQLNLIIHTYSLSVQSLQMWMQAEHKLIQPAQKDRAGAHSTREAEKLKSQLKEEHSWRFKDVSDIHWNMWANFIQSSPAHRRETLAKGSPPDHLSTVFRPGLEDASAKLSAMRKDLQVAKAVNASFGLKVKALQAAFDNLSILMADMKVIVNSLVEKVEEDEKLLTAVAQSATVEENELSLSLAGSVNNCLDTDHD